MKQVQHKTGRSDPPSKQEISKAIKELKTGKIPGIHNLPPEVFKQDPNISAKILHTYNL